MARFFFHLFTEDGPEQDGLGAEFPSIYNAYYEACRAIPPMAANFIAEGRDPMNFRFEIANAEGVALMEVPFCELRRARAAHPAAPPRLSPAHFLVGQAAAFQAAMNGAPLASSLAILIETAMAQSLAPRHCAFFLVGPDGELRHLVGMPSPERDAGFPIAPDRLDCWSFPLETAAGKVVGRFDLYFGDVRTPTGDDHALTRALCSTAAMIIAHRQAVEDQARLRRELARRRGRQDV